MCHPKKCAQQIPIPGWSWPPEVRLEGWPRSQWELKPQYRCHTGLQALESVCETERDLYERMPSSATPHPDCGLLLNCLLSPGVGSGRGLLAFFLTGYYVREMTVPGTVLS